MSIIYVIHMTYFYTPAYDFIFTFRYLKLNILII